MMMRELQFWGCATAFLAIAFYIAPVPVPEDWTNLRTASSLLLQRLPFYSPEYLYPPHVAIALLPFAFLPVRVGYALTCTFTLCLLTLMARQEKLGAGKTLALVLSPPVFYTLLHGQIDVLILGVMLLPAPLWGLAAFSKPQIAGGLALANWRGLALGMLLMIADLLAYPSWPIEALAAARDPIASGWNVLGGYWPQQLPIAAGLLVVGLRRRDHLWLLAASPFLLPYAALSSFSGIWWGLCVRMESYALVSVLVVWWGVIAWQLLN